jgi:hypothetical protein
MNLKFKILFLMNIKLIVIDFAITKFFLNAVSKVYMT